MSQDIALLDRNENNYGPAPACFEVLRSAGIEQTSRYSMDFSRGVKSVLSERLAGEHGIPESSVHLGYGSEDLLKQIVHCYLSKGETVLIPSHSWWYYKSIAAEKEGSTAEYPMRPGPVSFTYDVESLLRLGAERKPRLVLISSPNNPTGNSLAQEGLRRVLRGIPEAVVVLDEAYWGFSGEKEHPVKELLSEFPRLIIIRTFSKYYALAGIRIGFAFAGSGLSSLSGYSSRYLGFNRLSERLAMAALDSPEYYANIRRRMAEDKELIYRELGKLEGFHAFHSDANFVLAEIPGALREGLQAHLVARGLIIKFFKDERPLENCVRITVGTREQNVRLVEAIADFAGNKGPT